MVLQSTKVNNSARDIIIERIRPFSLSLEVVEKSPSHHLGFIGDKIGYRPVLIFNILLTGLASTSFIFMPAYKEYQKIPHAILYKNSAVGEDSAIAYTLVSVVWSTCDEELTECKWHNEKCYSNLLLQWHIYDGFKLLQNLNYWELSIQILVGGS